MWYWSLLVVLLVFCWARTCLKSVSSHDILGVTSVVSLSAAGCSYIQMHKGHTESVNRLASCCVLFYTILAGLPAGKTTTEHPVAWTERKPGPPNHQLTRKCLRCLSSSHVRRCTGQAFRPWPLLIKGPMRLWPKLGYQRDTRFFWWFPPVCLVFLIILQYLPMPQQVPKILCLIWIHYHTVGIIIWTVSWESPKSSNGFQC